MYSKITKIGIKHAKTNNEAKRIQLLNTYALIWIHFSLVFIIFDVSTKPLNMHMFAHIASIIILSSIFLLNKNKHFELAKAVFLFMSYVVISLLAVVFGRNPYTVIYLATIPLLVLSLYEKVTFAVITFCICLTTYNWADIFLKDEMTKIELLLHFLLLKNLVVTSLFFSFFFIVLYFKRTNIKNEQLLEKQRDKLEELNKFKSHFFVNLSHEIRTPITLIKGYTSKINLNDTKTVNEKKLTIVNSQIHQIETIINNILDLSKLDANKLDLEREYTKITPFLNKHYADFKELFIKKEISFTLTDKIPNILVDMDANMVSKSLNNLLTNALKFTPKKGEVHIEINYSSALEIAVIDNGLGVPEQDIHKIFERFYQSKNDITKSQGSGIGLSFTKSIIDAHGFSICVESTPKVKTSFKITIPQSFIKTSTEIEDNSNVKIHLPISTNKTVTPQIVSLKNVPTILVVDDHEQMRNYLKEVLSNYNVLEAENGKEALNILETEKIDLLVTDYMMPIMDGEELVKQVQKNDLKTPIIVLTARVDDSAKLTMLRIGVDGYLIKPFVEEELLLLIKNSLRFFNKIIETKKNLTILEKESLNKFSNDFEQEISKLIIDNIANTNFGVNDISNHFGVSTRTLNRKTKTILGQTTQQLITYTKIEKARQIQLKSPYLSQKEIANKVAISNTSYLFKKLAENYGEHYLK